MNVFFSRVAGFGYVRDILVEDHASLPLKLAIQHEGGTNRRERGSQQNYDHPACRETER